MFALADYTTLHFGPLIQTLMDLIELLIIGFIILIIGRIIKQFLKRYNDKLPNSLSGLLAIISFLQILVLSLYASYLFKLSDVVLIGSSTLLITVIGISSLGGFGSNILGGLWILFTHPYGVGDFITSASNPQHSGLVIDVSINYTKILKLNRKVLIIPNGIMFNSIISNSNLMFDKNYIIKHKLESNYSNVENKNKSKKQLNLSGNLIDSIFYGEYVYFTFNFEIKLELVKPEPTIQEIIRKLDGICEKFSPVFGFKPEYYFIDFTARLIVTFKLITKEPKSILYSYSTLLQEIANNLYLGFFEEEHV